MPNLLSILYYQFALLRAASQTFYYGADHIGRVPARRAVKGDCRRCARHCGRFFTRPYLLSDGPGSAARRLSRTSRCSTSVLADRDERYLISLDSVSMPGNDLVPNTRNKVIVADGGVDCPDFIGCSIHSQARVEPIRQRDVRERPERLIWPVESIRA